MRRRDFLKGIAAVLGAVGLPVGAAQTKPDEPPAMEVWTYTTPEWSEEQKRKMEAFLKTLAFKEPIIRYKHGLA